MVYLVKDFMTKTVVTIDGEASVAEASKILAETPRGYVLVLENGQSAGIVTAMDLVKKVVVKGLDPSTIKASEVMSTPLVTIDPDEELSAATEVMRKNHVRKLPVVRNGIIYGILTARDVLEHFTEYVDKAIREIITYTSPFSI
jgi:CBS domain-containing protein